MPPASGEGEVGRSSSGVIGCESPFLQYLETISKPPGGSAVIKPPGGSAVIRATQAKTNGFPLLRE